MRKIVILVLVIFCLGFYVMHTIAAERVHIKLKDQIGIAFINQSMLLVMEDNQSTLLVLDKGDLNNLNKFSYRNLNILTLKNIAVDVKSNTSRILLGEETIGEVTYKIENGLINIMYKGNNLCIYTGGSYNIDSCQFVYFYNTNISNLTVYDYNEVILYYYRNPLSKYIQERIYEQSIDTYPLRDDELTIIRLSDDDYDFIVIDNE